MQEHLCLRCRDCAPYVLPPVCPQCGRNEDDCTCGGKRHHFERCVMPFYYEGVAKKAIGTLKNQGYDTVVKGLSLEMAEIIRREYGGIPFDLVTPVPLHTRKLRERGFNQSALLAKTLAKITDISYVDGLYKLYDTPAQKELPLEGRKANLLGAFHVDEQCDVSGRTVLLVDDLLTTGSTLDECAKMLKIAGAKQVYAITAAAALLKKSTDPDDPSDEH